MTYRISLTSSARRAPEHGIPESVATAAWEFITSALAENPHRVGKPLMGDLDGLWSARRGTYRVIYAIDDHVVTVTVIRIGHRSEVYK